MEKVPSPSQAPVQVSMNDNRRIFIAKVDWREKQVYPKLSVFKWLIILFPFIMLLSGCGGACKSDLPHKEEIIAYVNKEPIYASELKKEIALRARHEPGYKSTAEAEADQLDIMIDRKLIIQEAVSKGLGRQEKFVATIKNFWEQALVRDFIEFKKKEFADYLFATEEEIKKYYGNLGKRITFKVLKSRDKNYIDAVYDEFIKNKEIDTAGWETIGPVGYEDIDSETLSEAFDLPLGGLKKAEDAPDYYIVMVSEKENVELLPLDTLKSQIERRVLAMKEKLLFNKWLKAEREKASVRILKK